MLVSEYRTFIAPNASTSKSEWPLPKSDTPAFSLPRRKSAPLSYSARPPLPNYLHNRNYLVNKERFFSQSDTHSNTLQRLQRLTKTQELPDAYSASFVTFMDLTKPKKALMPNPFALPNALDGRYKSLSLSNAKRVMSKTYIANDLYYKQVYAS